MERLASIRDFNSIYEPIGNTYQRLFNTFEDLDRVFKKMESNNIDMTHKCTYKPRGMSLSKLVRAWIN